jgi:hypothetical protein
MLLTVGALLACLALTAFATGPNLRDASLKVTKALPNGADNVTSDAIDTGVKPGLGTQTLDVEYLLSAPALAVADLADAATMTYDILVSANADMSSPTTLIAAAIKQTGAGGAGAAAATYRFRLPSSAARYLAFKATNSGAGDASDKSGTLEALL